MKNTIRFLLIGLIAISCSKTSDNFTKYEWMIYYTTYESSGNIGLPSLDPIERQRVMFRNDSAISYSEVKFKEVAFPMIKTDSSITFKRLFTIEEYMDHAKDRDTTVLDTMFFDFKRIMNIPTLVIKSFSSDDIEVLICRDPDAVIKETNNFFNLTNFEIGGYEIGDTINLDILIETDEDSDFEAGKLIQGKLLDNENINYEVIGKKYIYRIRQEQIIDDEVDGIVKVITDKMNLHPDTLYSYEHDFEGYIWEKDGIRIKLDKSNLGSFYLDAARTTADYTMKRVYLIIARNELAKANTYTLEYDNIVLQKVLIYLSRNLPISSSIIE